VTDFLDRPSPVRAGQGFDVAALVAWLRDRAGVALGADGAAPEVLQFGRGYSNLTYLVRSCDAAGPRELVVRRSPPGVAIKSAHDMGREYRILSALAPAWPKAPRPIAHCDDASVIGTPFYVMERVAGVILRARVPEGLELGESAMRRASEATCDTLAEIHELDWRALGLGDLGKPEGYVERQVRGWTERWRAARTDDVPQVEKLGRWLEEHRPGESGASGATIRRTREASGRDATIVHNDFKYDNVVLSSDLTQVLAVLDWEMATIGDPLMDLGTALGYWIQADDPPVFQVAVFGPTHRPGSLTRVEIVERWSRATGRDAGNVLFYFAFALFKLSVVAQQLYKRWVDGHTKEERYSMMLEGVRAVASSALVAIEKGRIDQLGE
jgi:aminoglycoside phosphotransferase (APT) family kinase protein